jgi:hypothetical protein
MAHYTQPAARIHIVQSFDFRGKAEEFSNRYSFKDSAPFTNAEWLALADGLINHLRVCFTNSTTFVRAYGYAPNAPFAEFVHDYSTGPPVAGSFTPSAGSSRCSGDTAAFLRLSSDLFTTRGKRIYKRCYYHDVHDNGPTAYDRLDAAQQSQFTTFGAALLDASIHPRFVVCLPRGDVAGGTLHSPRVDQWLTTRTLKRRGKRKKDAPVP